MNLISYFWYRQQSTLTNEKNNSTGEHCSTSNKDNDSNVQRYCVDSTYKDNDFKIQRYFCFSYENTKKKKKNKIQRLLNRHAKWPRSSILISFSLSFWSFIWKTGKLQIKFTIQLVVPPLLLPLHLLLSPLQPEKRLKLKCEYDFDFSTQSLAPEFPVIFCCLCVRRFIRKLIINNK